MSVYNSYVLYYAYFSIILLGAYRPGRKVCMYFAYFAYLTYFTYSAYFRYLQQCVIVFPYRNGNGNPIMATGKNHSIIHTPGHGPGDVGRYGDAINVSCDPPEDAHKIWAKEQGGGTNQGPQAQLSMMLHSLRKEASALLCEAVQGNIHLL